ncbi:receptor like protein 27-like [Ziziphus jujuba]|uniref:Receptor like protein 27-like n=1 Tax=Ziziphus jujuba TaxID=326968 RepID=A0ABM3II47_ZIZJJ|nr:receptor like protein 27-like [Ziziphus jujuba]
MELSLRLVSFLCVLLKLLALEIMVANSFTSFQPSCHDYERSALLQFKESFVIVNKSASLCDPKILQWNSYGVNTSNCCLWDGVQCDEVTGHVIGLDLSRSCLFGSINSNSTLFNLVHLQRLNLADFLRHQNQVRWISLSNNKISGEIPKWMWNTSTDTLDFLPIANNFITGSQPAIIPWVNMKVYIVSFNMLQGVPPIPPPCIENYNASENMLSGEISNMFCNLSSLYFLDLSGNALSGMIPKCWGNLSNSLYVLSLKNNFFQGIIPEICSNSASNLRIIDLSYNKLQGQLPRSLSNCMMLEGIVISNNQLKDVFPSWLGSLPVLKILTLQQNEFYGVIGKPKNYLEFPKLQVIDISFNYFTGELPSHYILCWNAMKDIDPHPLTYLSVTLNYTTTDFDWVQVDNRYAITITTKGVKRYYGAIQDIFTFIDMSSNRFEGQISELFGNLKGLYSLNLSNNLLTGCIPSSLGNLTVLESLDLSQNKLSGEIPKQLKQLGFLERFNVSHNNLTGRIPQGKQFDAFESSSFEGNPGLCGDPLLRKCGYSGPPSLPPSVFEENDDPDSLMELDWKVVLIGFVSGVVAGVALGDIVTIRRHGWLVKLSYKGRRQRTHQRNWR